MSGSDEERPLSSKDIFKYMEKLNKLVQDGVHSEVTAAIAPFRDKQNMIVDDLAQTKEKVTEIETDHEATKTKVNDLQQQLADLKHNLEQSNATFPPIPSYPAPLHTYLSPLISIPAPTHQVSHELKLAVAEARKVIGFSPITS